VTSAVSTTAATAVSRSTCFVAGEQHVAGDARPHQPDDRPAAVGGVHERPVSTSDLRSGASSSITNSRWA
jgi:hypothetical protein